MPRDANGNYTLPATGNPAVNGTVIDATIWWNPTSVDFVAAFSDSLSRSGQGGMLAPLKLLDGNEGAPSLAFTNESSTGLYRAGTGDLRAAVQAADVVRVTPSGLFVSKDAGTNWRTPGLLNDSATQTASALWNFTGGLQVNGVPIGSAALADPTGHSGQLLGTNGTLTIWGNTVTGPAATPGLTATGGSGAAGVTATGGAGNTNGIVGNGTGIGTGVFGIAGNGGGGGAGVYGQANGAATTGVIGEGRSSGLGVYGFSNATNIDVAKFDGYVDLHAATNPSATTGFSSRLTPKNIVKAWCSASITSGVVTVNDAFNVQAGGSWTLGITDITIPFATSMGSGSYAVVGVAATGQPIAFFVKTKNAGSVVINVMTFAAPGTPLNPNSSSFAFDFYVIGAQ